jgi:hypothetical protein
MMAKKFVPLMEAKIVDPEVRDWLVPTFSTTTENDRVVSSMAMMATMKEYFRFTMKGGCGFPSVTLLGEAGDWDKILTRLDKFAQYGDETATWSMLLTTILRRFIGTFFFPDSTQLKQFWMQAIHATGEWGSGRDRPTFDGWLTALIYWDMYGACMAKKSTVNAAGKESLVLDGVAFLIIDQSLNGIPSAIMEIPVIVQAHHLGLEFNTRIIVGSMGMTIRHGPKKKADAPDSGKVKQGKLALAAKDIATTVQPCSGWWMIEDGRKPLGGGE